MASSLIGGRGKDRVTDKGHGTDALGPSDSSDIVGGDVELDSDSDSAGTGEHMTAERGPLTRANDDVLPDHIERITEIVDVEEAKSGGKRG